MKNLTLKELRREFWSLMGNPKGRSRPQNDQPADIRAAWVDYVDSMQKDGRISEKAAQRADDKDHPEDPTPPPQDPEPEPSPFQAVTTAIAKRKKQQAKEDSINADIATIQQFLFFQ